MNETNKHTPWGFYIFGFFVVLSLFGVSFIPATMVYRLRLFDAVGLPDWMAEVLRFIIVAAGPLAVLTIGLVRVFAVSDAKHSMWMNIASVLEIVSFVSEVLAALVNGSDIFALAGQGLFLSLAIVSISAALFLTIAGSGAYKMAVAQRQQSITFIEELNRAFHSRMGSPEVSQFIDNVITSKIEKMAQEEIGVRFSFDNNHNGHVPEQTPGAAPNAKQPK